MTEKTIPTSLPSFQPLQQTMHGVPESQKEFFKTLSEQVGAWSRYNFGIQSAHRPAMGMVEELLELWEGLDLFDNKKAVDAIGDVTIYMADYCSIRGWNMGEVWVDREPRPLATMSSMNNALGQALLHSHLKGEQGIRGGQVIKEAQMREACSQTLWYLLSVTNYLGDDYLSLISDVWSVVQLRDWRANRDTAHTVAEQVVVSDSLKISVKSRSEVNPNPGDVAASLLETAQTAVARSTENLIGAPSPAYEVLEDEVHE